MYANTNAAAAAARNADLLDARQEAPAAVGEPVGNRFWAESLFGFGRQVRRHLENYPALFAGRDDAEGRQLHARALDTCRRLAREFEYLAFLAFTNPGFTEVNREALEAVVLDLRERAALLNEPQAAEVQGG